jgi:hypothetical protein
MTKKQLGMFFTTRCTLLERAKIAPDERLELSTLGCSSIKGPRANQLCQPGCGICHLFDQISLIYYNTITRLAEPYPRSSTHVKLC